MVSRSDDNKKKINEVLIESETHDLIVRVANIKGVSIRTFAGLILDDWATRHVPNLDSANEGEKSFWEYVEFKRRKLARRRAYEMASEYSIEKNENDAEKLQAYCDKEGIDYGSIIAEVGNDPFSSIVAESRSGEKITACISWIGRTIKTSGGRIDVAELERLGATEGYNKQLLDRAKKIVNQSPDTPQIASVRDGKGWTWELIDPKPQDKNRITTRSGVPVEFMVGPE